MDALETLTAFNAEFEIHPARAKTLYLQGIIERDGPGKHVLAKGIGEGQRELVEALLDLNGEYL